MSIERPFDLIINAGTSSPLVINANQNDSGEIWKFNLYQEDGTKVIPAAGEIVGLKADGHAIVNAGTVNESGQVVITETEQMTAAPGANVYEIVFDSVHGTANFILYVEKSPVDDDADFSESDISAINQAIAMAINSSTVQALQSKLAAETSARQSADNLLQTQIDEIIAPSGEAPSAAEVENARIGADGTVYDTLGNAIRGQVSDLNQALDGETSFVETGKISGIIKNVHVFGSGTSRYAITNINRNYSNFTGVVIYQVVNGSFGSATTISLSELSGHCIKIIGKEIVEFDYDLTGMADQTRITVHDDTAIINGKCYVKSESLISVGETAKALSNILVVLNNADTIYLANITRTANNTGTVSLYSRANSYAEVAVITLSALTGSVKYTDVTLGIEVSFDYDISWMSANQTISNYIDAHGEVKQSRVVQKIPEVLNVADYASVGLFESMGVVGDSYASGWVYRTDDPQNPYRCWEQSWIQTLSRKVGNTASNYSFGGLTTRSWLTHANGKTKLEAETAKQIYFLCLGINDVNALGMDYIGSGADYNNDADTFIGNYSHIIRIIQAHAPNAKLIMFTTPFTTNSTYVAFNNAIIAIANHFGLPYIEQYKHPYISSSAFQNGLQVGHPNAVMYSGMSIAFEEMINEILATKTDYFKNFTGSGRNN